MSSIKPQFSRFSKFKELTHLANVKWCFETFSNTILVFNLELLKFNVYRLIQSKMVSLQNIRLILQICQLFELKKSVTLYQSIFFQWWHFEWDSKCHWKQFRPLCSNCCQKSLLFNFFTHSNYHCWLRQTCQTAKHIGHKKINKINKFRFKIIYRIVKNNFKSLDYFILFIIENCIRFWNIFVWFISFLCPIIFFSSLKWLSHMKMVIKVNRKWWRLETRPELFVGTCGSSCPSQVF